jgi:protoheme IX farnesyltransferase
MNAHAIVVSRTRLADWWTLTKPGITGLVLVTTAVGFYLASAEPLNWLLLVNALLGTALVSAGSGALNMAVEHERDARMGRTEDRPVASGRMAPLHAVVFGLALSGAGLVLLAVSVNPLTGLLACASLAVYILAYTPLKTRTTLCTLVGSVSGAIPPVIGWTAARGELEMGAWALFAILFFWQLPHFLAIAWMCREDYERAGFAMMPVLDQEGISTARQSVLQTTALIAASLLPAWLGLAGPVYLVASGVLGAAFLAFAMRFLVERSRGRARSLFLASIAYLPALLAVLAIAKN